MNEKLETRSIVIATAVALVATAALLFLISRFQFWGVIPLAFIPLVYVVWVSAESGRPLPHYGALSRLLKAAAVTWMIVFFGWEVWWEPRQEDKRARVAADAEFQDMERYLDSIGVDVAWRPNYGGADSFAVSSRFPRMFYLIDLIDTYDERADSTILSVESYPWTFRLAVGRKCASLRAHMRSHAEFRPVLMVVTEARAWKRFDGGDSTMVVDGVCALGTEAGVNWFVRYR